MPRFEFDGQRYPSQPGCYLMKDAAGDVIYVGKAKNLRRRLASYFRPRHKYWKAARLAAQVVDVKVIVVNNETESLILENNLIKRYRPRYNAMLMREGSGYFYIVLTREGVPRFAPYRKRRMNKELEGTDEIEARFGPYLSRRFRDVLLDFLAEAFQIRTCKSLPERACLRFHIQRCSGICEARISTDQYAGDVERAVAFLSRRHTDLIGQMKRRMQECAERFEFEKAQRIRDQVAALESALEKQIVERDVAHDQDVIYFGERKVLVAEIKRGMLQGLSWFDLDLVAGHARACERFLVSHYARNSPRELIVNRLTDAEKLAEALTAANQHRVEITLPSRGEKLELLKLCERNYDYRVSVDAPPVSNARQEI